MKLRTQMQDFHGRMLPRSSKPQPHFDFEHDAMAAHALLQAINDTRDNPYLYGGTGGQPELVIEMIEKRAAEILAGWLGEDRG